MTNYWAPLRLSWSCDACQASGSFELEPSDSDAGYERMLVEHGKASPSCARDDKIRARFSEIVRIGGPVGQRSEKWA